MIGVSLFMKIIDFSFFSNMFRIGPPQRDEAVSVSCVQCALRVLQGGALGDGALQLPWRRTIGADSWCSCATLQRRRQGAYTAGVEVRAEALGVLAIAAANNDKVQTQFMEREPTVRTTVNAGVAVRKVR